MIPARWTTASIPCIRAEDGVLVTEVGFAAFLVLARRIHRHDVGKQHRAAQRF